MGGTPPDSLIAPYLVHELRTPVFCIRLSLEQLKEPLATVAGETSHMILDLALKNTERLGRMVNDILDYCKTQEKQLTLSLEPVSPRKLVYEAVDALSDLAREKRVELVWKRSQEVPSLVRADPHRVMQILFNLISNAIKFTPAGGKVEVGVARGRRGAGAGFATFSIRDTGCGIAENDMPRIFEAFHQAAEGRKMSSGTGLGLTLARVMVELHGGRIWAESKSGVGSIFNFTLPVAV